MTSNPLAELLSNLGPKPDAQIAFKVMTNTAAHITNDDSYKQLSYDEYKKMNDNEGMKLSLASICPYAWRSSSRNHMHKQNTWPTPYGYYYVWQFSIPMLTLNNLEYRDKLALTHREQIGDLVGESDFARFNHIGRMLYIIAYNIHTLTMKNQDKNTAVVREWYDSLVDYKNTVIKTQMTDAAGSVTREQWEFSNEAFDNFEPVVETSFALLDAVARGVNTEDDLNNFVMAVDGAVAYLNRMRESDMLNEKDIICDDIVQQLETLRGLAILSSDKKINDMMAHLAQMLSE